MFYEADIGLAAFKVDEDDRQTLSSQRPRNIIVNFPQLPTLHDRIDSSFVGLFRPSSPSLLALASSIYPLGKLGHSGMDLSL